MHGDKEKLEKIIKYRLSYSGMKETDILYKRLILDKLKYLNENELKLLSNLFTEVSDVRIFNMLTSKEALIKKYENLIKKILNGSN
jgi:succinate dehydrogenase flavin-adding protein (antitoxin of CptAB toxin-antitoxin module)